MGDNLRTNNPICVFVDTDTIIWWYLNDNFNQKRKNFWLLK